jgi:hypothetical protein
LRGYDTKVTVHMHQKIRVLRAITIECECGISHYLALGKYVDEALRLKCPDVREPIGDPPDHLMARAHEAGVQIPYIPGETEGDSGVIGVVTTWDWWLASHPGAPGTADVVA